MGRTKQLLLLDDKLVIRHCLDALFVSGIRDIRVVVSPQNGGDIAERLHGLAVKIVINDAPNSEMSDSIRAGLRSLDHVPTGVLVCLSDYPLVLAQTIRAIMDAYIGNPNRIIIPVYRGRRGHPTLFPATIINEIFSGMTLRDIVRNNPQKVLAITVDDEGVVFDLDNEDDYRIMKQKFMPDVS